MATLQSRHDHVRQIHPPTETQGLAYDRGHEQFLGGARVLDWEEVIGLLPNLSLDELASYHDDQYDRTRAGR